MNLSLSRLCKIQVLTPSFYPNCAMYIGILVFSLHNVGRSRLP